MRKKKLGLAFALAAGSFAIGLGRRLRASSYTFRDKVVVITGGGRGLGLAMARELATQGARLALLARDEAELERARVELVGLGARVLVARCDVTDRAAVVRAIDEVVARFGGIDVLINNAGVIQVGPFEEMTVADFDTAFEVHVFGPLYTVMAALPYLRRSGQGGRIVNIASIGGRVAVPHLSPYCASKHGLVGLSESLRHELRKDGIRVTTVCPGLMRTGSPPHAIVKGRHEAEYGLFAALDVAPLVAKDAGRAARQILAACRRGAASLTITPQARLAELAQVLAPELTALALGALGRVLPAPTGEREARLGADVPLPGRVARRTEALAARHNEQTVRAARR